MQIKKVSSNQTHYSHFSLLAFSYSACTPTIVVAIVRPSQLVTDDGECLGIVCNGCPKLLLQHQHGCKPYQGHNYHIWPCSKPSHNCLEVCLTHSGILYKGNSPLTSSIYIPVLQGTFCIILITNGTSTFSN